MYFSTGQEAQAIGEPCGGVWQHCAGVCSSVPTHRVDAFVTLYTNRRSPPRHHVGASSDPAQLSFPSTTATRAWRSRKAGTVVKAVRPVAVWRPVAVRWRPSMLLHCPWQLTLHRTCATVAAAAEFFCPVAVQLDSRESRDADKKT